MGLLCFFYGIGKEKVKRKINITNRMIIISAFFMFSMILGITIITNYYVGSCSNRVSKAQNNRYEWARLGEELGNTSDYLTNEVRQYVITGDYSHFYNYWNEIYEEQRREQIIEELQQCHLTKREMNLLKKAKDYSDQLVETEEEAMRLKMEVTEIVVNHNDKMEHYKQRLMKEELPEQYQDLSDHELSQKAVELLYNEHYERIKSYIVTPIGAFQNSIDQRVNEEVENTESRLKVALRIQKMCEMLSLCLIGLWLYLIERLYVSPIRTYTQIISDKNSRETSDIQELKITPSGVYEMKFMGEEFNKLSDILQKELTLRKEAENRMRMARDRANEASQAKTEFLAKMSHEFRTPLNSMIGYLYLLEKSPMTREQEEYCQSMKISLEGLLDLINQVLDLSKIESGQMVFEYREINIRTIIKEVCVVMRQTAEEKGLKLHITIGEEIPEMVLGDAFRLKQVFMNLIGNAIKFSSQGQILVDVRLKKIMNHHCIIFFGVKDHGIGISEDGKKIIFQDFVQSDSTITRRFGGTGLGLPIAKKIIEEFNHGKDTLHVESEEGKGAFFYFTMNFQVVDKTIRLEETEEKEYKFCGQKVLLVDDHEMNLRVEKRILQREGLCVDTANSGEHALKMIDGEIYELVILDIRMPDMSGYELAKQIRRKPEYRFIPLIALTADAMDGMKEKIKSAGIDYYLAKPLRPANLLHILNHELTVEERDYVVFDGKELLETLDHDKEAYGELLEMFLHTQKQNLKKVRNALLLSDYEELENILHAMKGTAGSLYCNLLYHTVEHLYKKTRGGQRIKLDKLLDVWDKTESEIKEELIKKEARVNV